MQCNDMQCNVMYSYVCMDGTDGINRQKKNILQQVGAKGIQVTRFVEFLRALFICSNLVGPIF